MVVTQNNSTSPDIISTIIGLLDQLSKSEKKVANLLIETPDLFVKSSVKEVAKITGVSEPTVVRFARNVGFKGFKDLKFSLVQQLAIHQALKDANEGAPLTYKKESFINHICNSAIKSLHNAADTVNVDDLNLAAKKIASSKRVFIFGIGGSSAILANEMHNRLFRLNITCTPFTDSYLQRMSAATMQEGDVALFISSTGRPKSLIDSAELAQHYGASSIAISAMNSSLARNVDICLNVDLTQLGVTSDQPNPMRFAQLLIIDCLVHQVAQYLGKHADDSLNRVRASIASINGIIPQQPIGD